MGREKKVDESTWTEHTAGARAEIDWKTSNVVAALIERCRYVHPTTYEV